MYVWMPVIVWGVTRVIRALVNWRAKVDFEKARAASVVAVVSAVPEGGTVQERRTDGTVLFVSVPAGPEQIGGHPHETAGPGPC